MVKHHKSLTSVDAQGLSSSRSPLSSACNVPFPRVSLPQTGCAFLNDSMLLLTHHPLHPPALTGHCHQYPTSSPPPGHRPSPPFLTRKRLPSLRLPSAPLGSSELWSCSSSPPIYVLWEPPTSSAASSSSLVYCIPPTPGSGARSFSRHARRCWRWHLHMR